MPGHPPDVTGLLRTLLADDPGRPRLTWYGPGAERVELSAKVLDNWVAKTANLLVDELDAGPGSRILLDLPAHWRSVVWLLAIWSVGGCAVLPDGSGPAADVVVSAEPDRGPAAAGAVLVAVALPALAGSFGPDLPPGAIDAAAAVRSHGDVFVPLVHPAAVDPAWAPAGDGGLSHAELLPAARAAAERAGYPSRVRLLTSSGPQRALRDWLGPLALTGSLVLHHDLAGLSDEARKRLAEQEAVTVTAP